MHIPGISFTIVLITGVFFLSQYLSQKGNRAALLSRKLLHIAGVGGLAIAPFLFENDNIITAIACFFSIFLFVAVWRRWFKVDIYNRLSWGIALFPLSFLALWLFWGRANLGLVLFPMLVLTFADAGAAISGHLFAKRFYNLTGDAKSIVGSAVFVLLTFVVLFALAPFIQGSFPEASYNIPEEYVAHHYWLIILVISLFAACAEGLTSGGWDNVTVPLSVSWLMAMLPVLGHPPIIIMLIFCSLAVLAFLAWKKKWLDGGGSISALLVGFVVWVAGGWQSIFLLGLFFITGSVFSVLENQNKKLSGAKIGKPRDYVQVICNGGIAAFCMVCYSLFQSELAMLAFCISVAVSTSDTWSSTIGNWAQGRVVDIINFRPLPIGISGGISWQGTVAGMAGAGLIAFAAHLLGVGFGFGWWIAGFGFLGMLTDSLIGSIWQRRYIVNGTLLEESEELDHSKPAKGLKWMTNDLVNLISNLIITIFATGLWYFMWIRR